jgi:hypothetical protein
MQFNYLASSRANVIRNSQRVVGAAKQKRHFSSEFRLNPGLSLVLEFAHARPLLPP